MKTNVLRKKLLRQLTSANELPLENKIETGEVRRNNQGSTKTHGFINL